MRLAREAGAGGWRGLPPSQLFWSPRRRSSRAQGLRSGEKDCAAGSMQLATGARPAADDGRLATGARPADGPGHGFAVIQGQRTIIASCRAARR